MRTKFLESSAPSAPSQQDSDGICISCQTPTQTGIRLFVISKAASTRGNRPLDLPTSNAAIHRWSRFGALCLSRKNRTHAAPIAAAKCRCPGGVACGSFLKQFPKVITNGKRLRGNNFRSSGFSQRHPLGSPLKAVRSTKYSLLLQIDETQPEPWELHSVSTRKQTCQTPEWRQRFGFPQQKTRHPQQIR